MIRNMDVVKTECDNLKLGSCTIIIKNVPMYECTVY